MKIKELILFVKEHRALIFSAVLFLTASHICSQVFPLDPQQNREWWWLRAVFYSLQNYITYWIAMRLADKVNLHAGALCCVMAGIALSDACDKLGKEYDYTWWDVPVIILTIIYTIKKYAKNHLVHNSQQG